MDEDDHPWGVKYNRSHVSRTNNIRFKDLRIETTKLECLSKKMKEVYRRNVITDEERVIRQQLIKWLDGKLIDVYPGGFLACGGSTVSSCGSMGSDIDLCYVLKTKSTREQKELPIEMYTERKVNHFILNRIAVALNGLPGIDKLRLVDATVPIAKMQINLQQIGLTVAEKFIDVDINCNCVAGVYNSYLLGGLVNFDKRLAILSVIIKEWGKNVKIVEEKRFNSYALVLLIVHYLQCGVYPPVLPNLMRLLPSQYDGTIEIKKLTTSLDGLDQRYLQVEKNNMSVGELLIGFLKYYSYFDMSAWGIRIKTGEAMEMNPRKLPKGAWSKFFLEEPYDEITVPKNLREQRDIDHIHEQFQEMTVFMHESPSLDTLHSVEKEYRSKRQRLRALEVETLTKGRQDESI